MNIEILQNISTRLLNKDETMPYGLLLDADPSMEAISKYLPSSDVYVTISEEKIVACFVLYTIDARTIEIKNIAVTDSLQGKGIGKFLLRQATQIARDKGAVFLTIGTSNASIGQLYLYQKEGFEITAIKHNFFSEHYPEPIFENGIQCRHMLMLTKHLS